MSRSWERKIRKNTADINKRRKKLGMQAISAPGSQVDRFRGRNYIMPIFLILFTGFYAYMVTIPAADPDVPNPTESSMFWITIASYFLLAALFYFRRPYLAVGKDFVGTRKWSGDKTMYANTIKSITVQPGYVVIEPTKGANWVFSKTLNLYPTDAMADRLKQFAADHKIPFEAKQK